MNIENRHIIIWGDSILKGIVFDESEKRYKILQENCIHRFELATKCKITNHACFGMTAGKAVDRIKRSLERTPLLSTDIVLIEYGGNDCDYYWEKISEHPELHHDSKTPIKTFESRLLLIIESFKQFGITPFLMSLPPLEPFRYFDWISKNLNKENILRWLGDINQIYRRQEAYNDIVVQTARINKLPLIDVRQNFLLSDQYSTMLCIDGIHPSEAGHKNIFDSLINFTHAFSHE